MATGYGQRGKSAAPRGSYLNWGGFFPHPESDDISDLLSYLPEWHVIQVAKRWLKQGYKLPPYLQELAQTPEPRPLASLRFAAAVPPMLEQLAFEVDEDISLDVLRLIDVERKGMRDAELTHDDFEPLMAKLREAVTLASVLRHCTANGKGKRIKTSKPEDGLHAYVWRMARLFDGSDSRMPVTIDFDLSDGLSALVGRRITTYLRNDYAKAVCDFLEAYSNLLVLATGGNPMAGSLRWGAAVGWNEHQTIEKAASRLGMTTEQLTSLLQAHQIVEAKQCVAAVTTGFLNEKGATK